MLAKKGAVSLNPENEGPYRLESVLGEGGMASVYRAYDTRRERYVALKILSPQLSSDPDFKERFLRETQILARLNNAHIVTLHDFGALEGGRLFIDMQLIDGPDLGTHIVTRGRLQAHDAIQILGQLAGAIGAAHRDGVLHRDIKTRNVLLRNGDDTVRAQQPYAYLADFGIAKTQAGTLYPDLTRPGSVVGTPEYMAPELTTLDCGPSAASDTYSLACVFYEMLTGTRVFPEHSGLAALTAHATIDPEPPSVRSPGLTNALDGVLAKGLAKSPPSRFQSPDELFQAARDAIDTTQRVEPIVVDRSRGMSLGRVASLLVAVAALAGIGGFLISQGLTPSSSIQADDANRPTVNVPQQTATIDPTSPAPTTTSLSPTPTTSVAEVGVRQQTTTPIRVTRGSGIDLDSRSPNWDIQRYYVSGPFDAAYIDRGIIRSDSGDFFLTDQPPSYESCSSATELVDSVSINDVGVGAGFCILTNQGNYGYLTVPSIDDSTATLSIIVWQP